MFSSLKVTPTNQFLFEVIIAQLKLEFQWFVRFQNIETLKLMISRTDIRLDGYNVKFKNQLPIE